MTDRELRLRERIDELADQRDAALDLLWRARGKRDRYRIRAWTLQRQVDYWRTQALGARHGRATGGVSKRTSRSAA